MKHINDIDSKEYERLQAIYRKSQESESVNERNIAAVKFLDKLEAMGMTYEEWLGNNSTEWHIRIRLEHKKLFYHSLWVIFGREYWRNYDHVISARGNIVKTEFMIRGSVQLVAEFRQYYYFHIDNYDQEVDIFMSAYIHAQQMYGPPLGATDDDHQQLTEEQMARAHKVGHMSVAIGKTFKKYIQ